ncbi:MAG TPA: CBS domain-containing protein [Spirochaetia bacterium]|nr:CBS domain-containing protein [Spirochaetales bacterium]HRY79602.1 CBS domain-containing protein [Spirochaetia bacterium]
MLVQELMTKNPLTTTPDTSVPDALALMRQKKVRRLPVLDKTGKLVGIVSDQDLLYASPSPATSLSVFEINSLIAKITVAHVMTKKVVTITEDLPVEEAARIMADKKIGGLPVMKGTKLAGIVTETDLFRALLQLLGGRRSGVRVTVQIPGAKGTFAKISGIVSAAGGDIVGLGVTEAQGVPGDFWHMTLKVQDLTKKAVSAAFAKAGVEVVDIRETKE